MEANELRVGNLVYVDDKEYHSDLQGVPMYLISIYNKRSLKEYCVTVDKLNRNKYDFQTALRLRYIKPIPLTEEILLKCGFINHEPKDWGSFSLGNIYFLLEDGNKMNGLYMNGYRVADIKYLHQIQNLYFAITGKELQIEL